MQFWKRRRRVSQQGTTPSDTGQVRKAKRTIKRSPPVAMEVKLLAIEALEAGLSAAEVGELVAVGATTVRAWQKDHAEGGVAGLTAALSLCRVYHREMSGRGPHGLTLRARGVGCGPPGNSPRRCGERSSRDRATSSSWGAQWWMGGGQRLEVAGAGRSAPGARCSWRRCFWRVSSPPSASSWR